MDRQRIEMKLKNLPLPNGNSKISITNKLVMKCMSLPQKKWMTAP